MPDMRSKRKPRKRRASTSNLRQCFRKLVLEREA